MEIRSKHFFIGLSGHQTESEVTLPDRHHLGYKIHAVAVNPIAVPRSITLSKRTADNDWKECFQWEYVKSGGFYKITYPTRDEPNIIVYGGTYRLTSVATGIVVYFTRAEIMSINDDRLVDDICLNTQRLDALVAKIKDLESR